MGFKERIIEVVYYDNMNFRIKKKDYISNRVFKAVGIPGWFSDSECKTLYEVTLLTDGPILEIGHFLERSSY